MNDRMTPPDDGSSVSRYNKERMRMTPFIKRRVIPVLVGKGDPDFWSPLFPRHSFASGFRGDRNEPHGQEQGWRPASHQDARQTHLQALWATIRGWVHKDASYLTRRPLLQTQDVASD